MALTPDTPENLAYLRAQVREADRILASLADRDDFASEMSRKSFEKHRLELAEAIERAEQQWAGGEDE